MKKGKGSKGQSSPSMIIEVIVGILVVVAAITFGFSYLFTLIAH